MRGLPKRSGGLRTTFLLKIRTSGHCERRSERERIGGGGVAKRERVKRGKRDKREKRPENSWTEIEVGDQKGKNDPGADQSI